MSAASVVVASGSGSGARLAIPRHGLVVGREVEGDGRLPGDDSLSRRHARFTTTASGEVVLEDLGSTNGTFVNDARVVDPVVLRDGDVVRVGDTYLEFSAGAAPGVAAAMGGVAVGGGIHADRGSIGAIGEVTGNVDLSDRSVTAAPGGHAAGRDLYHEERYEYDASGLGVITRARGTARFLIVLGTLVGLVGFGLFGYPIVQGIVNAASGSSAADEAQRECDERFPDRGFEWNECQFEAAQLAGGDFPSLTPWLPVGLALFFAGMVLSTIGVLMIRRDD